MKNTIRIIAFVCVVIASFVPSFAGVYYEVTELRVPEEASSSSAINLNDKGQVVGAWSTKEQGRHAFVWENGIFTEIKPAIGDSIRPTAINNNGEVVGHHGNNNYAFVWKNGITQIIGSQYSMANDINDHGQVVVQQTTPGGSSVSAIIWQNEQASVIGQFYPTTINNNGQVSGYYLIVSTKRACIWSNSQMIDLGTLGGREAQAFDINDQGQAVGISATSNDTWNPNRRAFLWEDGVMRNLGSLGGECQAQGINEKGQVVGHGTWRGNAGFIWQDGQMYDLTDLVGRPEWWITSANAINELGQITCGAVRNGRSRAVLLTPITVAAIDIKPGEGANSINLRSAGVVPVAVITNAEFDASTVDPSTVVFAGAMPVKSALVDVDQDLDLDLLLHFKTQDLELDNECIEAELRGRSTDGKWIKGTDSVVIKGVKK